MMCLILPKNALVICLATIYIIVGSAEELNAMNPKIRQAVIAIGLATVLNSISNIALLILVLSR